MFLSETIKNILKFLEPCSTTEYNELLKHYKQQLLKTPPSYTQRQLNISRMMEKNEDLEKLR